jgi:CDP-diacylglycerol--glycerol-3-phosphate 3-phosphatidyltransferase
MARAGITANQVTVSACIASVAVGIFLCFHTGRWLLILPPFLFIRMALNAVDGMLAREFGQKSSLGAYLNELTDVIADACLYLPFAYIGFDPLWIGVVIVLGVISEMAGVVGVMTGASRRYDGPMGKSDRAFVFGATALWLGFGLPFPPEAAFLFPLLMAFFLAMTIVNRVRRGLAELQLKTR